MAHMDTNEAAKALFFLQTSPVIARFDPKRRFPKLDLGGSSHVKHSAPESRTINICSPDPDVNLKPGSALLALLDLNKICQQGSSSSESSDDGGYSPKDFPSSPSSCPSTGGRPSSLSFDVVTRDRSESVAAVEKRFSSDAMSIGQSKIGHYSREERRRLIDRFLQKRNRRIWRKRVKYDVRKSFADSRLRVKGRFVRKEDEDQLRDLLILSF